jgi:hypothetical protein
MARSIDKRHFCSLGECPPCKFKFRHEEHECRRAADFSGYTIMNSNETGQMGYLRHRKSKVGGGTGYDGVAIT